MPQLDKRAQLLFAESCSSLGRKWLSVIPSCPTFAISNTEVQANLIYRSLMPLPPTPCRACNLPNYRGHAEVCKGRSTFFVSRHKSVKHQLANAARTMPNMTVTVEPYIRGTTRRNNIALHYHGNRSRDASTEEYGLAVVGITAPTHIRSTAKVIRMTGEDRPNKVVTAGAQRILSAKARLKSRNLPDKPDDLQVADTVQGDGDVPFVPLAVTSNFVRYLARRYHRNDTTSLGDTLAESHTNNKIPPGGGRLRRSIWHGGRHGLRLRFRRDGDFGLGCFDFRLWDSFRRAPWRSGFLDGGRWFGSL